MTKLVTSNFNVHNAKQFVESVTESANNVYYVMIGNHMPFPDGDGTAPTGNNSPEDSYYQVYRDGIYGKKINSTDIKHMINNNLWSTGTVYSQYEHDNGNLRNEKFYAHVKEANGTYSVFKCLYNNKGAASTDEPSALETSADDDVYITTVDKYQWKLMYQIEESNFNKFATSEKIPVYPNADVSGNAVPGAIDVINVNTGGARFNAVANGVIKVAQVAGNPRIFELESLQSANVTLSSVSNGTFTVERVDLFGKHSNGHINSTSFNTSNNIAQGVVVEANSTVIRVQDIANNFFGQQSNVVVQGQTSGAFSLISEIDSSTSSLSANTDFYKGGIFYIAAGGGKGASAVISEYIVTGSARRVLLANDTGFSSVDSTSLFEISPSVTIRGDGTGAEARAIVNTQIFAVDTIEVTKRGSGYTFATATVIGNTGIANTEEANTEINFQANTANVNVIIGPKGGHGSDVINELYADNIGISIDFLDDEGGNTPANNDFREISILKDPLYSNVIVTLANTTTTLGTVTNTATSFTANEVVTQNASTNALPTAKGATGVIKARGDGTMNISNVYGQFLTTTNANTTHRLFGETSNSSTTIDSFQTSDKSTADFNTFDQRLRLVGFVNSALTFSIDEQIIQDSTNAEGVIHSINTHANGTINMVGITRKKGNFLASDTVENVFYNVRGQTSNAIGYFIDTAGPDIVPNSGEVIYTENLTPITRDNSQTERIKIILGF